MHARRRALIVLLLVATSLLAGGCRKVLSEPVLEATAEDLMFTIADARVEVDCPHGVTMRAQEDFFCRTSIADRRGYLLVRQLDDYGRVEFERETPLDPAVVEPIVEGYLAREFGIDAAARCPGEVIQEPDENFRCRLDGDREDVLVRQVDGVDEYALQWLGADRTGGRARDE